MRKYFEVEINRYMAGDGRKVYRPASLNYPKDEAVMFITEENIQQADSFLKCSNCLIFWPKHYEVPKEVSKRHAACLVQDPHQSFAKFFFDNKIAYLPKNDSIELVNGAYVSKKAQIGSDCAIFPGAYIGSEVTIGDNVYIGSGVKLVGEVVVGNDVVIRENTVIGADGLTIDRDETGRALTIPQFGGVIIEDNVQIGANSIIARGAIDNTYISKGCRIGNLCSIGHNNFLSENVFMVSQSITFGSVKVGKNTLISGNATIRNGISIGENCLVGAGSVVLKSIENNSVVSGNPARQILR